VIWNLGAIAASRHPDALKLFRAGSLASASTPVALNPVYIKVKAAGRNMTRCTSMAASRPR